MKKSIVALIGGIFGTIAAVVTLFAGGLVAGLEGASPQWKDSIGLEDLSLHLEAGIHLC